MLIDFTSLCPYILYGDGVRMGQNLGNGFGTVCRHKVRTEMIRRKIVKEGMGEPSLSGRSGRGTFPFPGLALKCTLHGWSKTRDGCEKM